MTTARELLARELLARFAPAHEAANHSLAWRLPQPREETGFTSVECSCGSRITLVFAGLRGRDAVTHAIRNVPLREIA